MAVSAFLKKWLSRSQKVARNHRGNGLALESLEDRAVPAVVYNLASVQNHPENFSSKSVLVTFAPSFKIGRAHV